MIPAPFQAVPVTMLAPSPVMMPAQLLARGILRLQVGTLQLEIFRWHACNNACTNSIVACTKSCANADENSCHNACDTTKTARDILVKKAGNTLAISSRIASIIHLIMKVYAGQNGDMWGRPPNSYLCLYALLCSRVDRTKN